MGERTGVDSIRSLASILIQAEKFGTSVGKTLRSHSETLRTRRRQDAEEKAAKTTGNSPSRWFCLFFPRCLL